jgi:nucleoside-diphosphate-sugar epimerase
MAYTCVVTGATGFVGTELCKQLLERGWNVRACVRDTSNARRVEPLLRLAAALPGSLQLVEADLLRAGSFHQACADCDFVFHVASPFFFGETDTQKDIVEPAVQGTRNVLLACAATKASLRRVVLTSSVAGELRAAAARVARVSYEGAACVPKADARPLPSAVKGNVGAQPPLNGKLYTEEDWNDTSSVESGEGYWLSKTQARSCQGYAACLRHSYQRLRIPRPRSSRGASPRSTSSTW